MAQMQLFWRAVAVSFALAPFVFGADAPQLTGVANFRDTGGYRTADGLRIKRGLIYRSGELSSLTADDQRALETLQIGYEFDLRTEKERAEAPSRWGVKAPAAVAISVGEPRDGVSRSTGDLRTAEGATLFVQDSMARIAVEGAPEIGEVIVRLARGQEPALIHCTAGMGRTGVTVAVLMKLLGTSDEDIYREYLRSNDGVTQFERLRSKEGLSGPPQPAEIHRVLTSVQRSYLEAAFHAIDKQYGSFDGYAKNGLKITPGQIGTLKARLLEK